LKMESDGTVGGVHLGGAALNLPHQLRSQGPGIELFARARSLRGKAPVVRRHLRIAIP
jgi:hypothetical protein